MYTPQVILCTFITFGGFLELLWQRPRRCLTLSTHAFPLTKLDDGLSSLHSAGYNAVQGVPENLGN